MKIAVVIPCRNEVKNIEECIRAIYASDLSDDCHLAVNVVDGMSNDGTRELLQSLQQEFPGIQLVNNEKQLTPFAFNLGIYATKDADFYQIIGARQVISSNYLRKAVESLKADPTVWCVGGAVENVYLNEQGRMIAQAMGTAFGMGLGNFRTLEQSSFVDTVGTPMYPAWVFEKIGYFDEELVRNQDDEFNFRVTQAGGRILFNAEISLKYYVRGSYPNLWKQFLQYGYWKVYVNKKHRAVTTLRQLVPPLFVFYLIFCLLPFVISPVLGLVSVSGVALYFIMNILFSLKTSANLKEASNLFVIYPILHISYGWGYLKGLIHFLLLNKKPGSSFSELSR